MTVFARVHRINIHSRVVGFNELFLSILLVAAVTKHKERESAIKFNMAMKIPVSWMHGKARAFSSPLFLLLL